MIFRPCTSARVGRDIWTLGLYELWYRRTEYVVDDQHVELRRGMLSRVEEVVPADKIVAVKTNLSPMLGGSKVTVDTGFGKTLEFTLLTRRQARELAAAARGLKEAIDARRMVAVTN